MGKIEFLQQLEAGLGRAAPDERVAAMQYYSEYLDEAGPDREAEVLAELGDPKKLAEEILGAPAPAQPAAQGAGWAPPTPPPRLAHGQPFNAPPPPPRQNPFDQNAPRAPEPPPQAGYAGPATTVPAPVPQPRPYNPANSNMVKFILFILIVIFLSPAVGGLLMALFILVGVAVFLAVLPFIIAVILVAAGVAATVVGGIVTAASVGTGLFAIGSGIFAMGLGLLAFMGGLSLMRKAIPAMFRGIVSGFRFTVKKIKGFLGRGEQNG